MDNKDINNAKQQKKKYAAGEYTNRGGGGGGCRNNKGVDGNLSNSSSYMFEPTSPYISMHHSNS